MYRERERESLNSVSIYVGMCLYIKCIHVYIYKCMNMAYIQ